MMMLRSLTGGLMMIATCVWLGCDRSQPQNIEADEPVAQTRTDSLAYDSPDDSLTGLRQDPSENPDGSAGVEAGGDRSTSKEIFSNADIEAPRLDDQTGLRQRPFATLQPLQSEDPVALMDHLAAIDAALKDLVLAGSSNQMDEQGFTAAGLRLGRMKRAAGQQLADAPSATPAHRKAGQIAQLVALSHMSGLRDVASARELEQFAGDLSRSNDPDLAHQARVVLLGFELQSLQNGVQNDPQRLLDQLQALFVRPQDRSFPEFMVLQQAQQVLSQMGFADAAAQVRETLIREFRQSPDRQLRGEAWLTEVQSSQAYQNFLQAFQAMGTSGFDRTAALAAVRGLYQAFPSPQTIEQLVGSLSNIEYGGEIEFSQSLADYVDQALESHPDYDAGHIRQILDAHRARMGLLGQPLELKQLISFDGQPLDWSAFAGRVVLVDFWASWCVPCLREMPNIQRLAAEFPAEDFQVLSINMDQNLATAREFVQRKSFPWPTFHATPADALGFAAPWAERLGIVAIPFVLLIDRDGRVAAMHLRGQDLRPRIVELLEQPQGSGQTP